MKIAETLRQTLTGGSAHIGEIVISAADGTFRLHHHDDADTNGLTIYGQPEDAREIAKYDEAGCYRPLKSAPNLRAGWMMILTGIDQLKLALDFFYPAMVGASLAARGGCLKPIHFRETAARQSGMYAVVKKITNAQADELIGSFCRSDGGCLKTILWQLDAGTPVTSLPQEKFDLGIDQLTQRREPATIPLPCAEACNLLIASARAVVKTSPA